MIKNFQESDFIDAFQDLPIYIGNDQSGEMIFKRLTWISMEKKLNLQFHTQDKTLPHSHRILKELKSNPM